MMYFYKILSLFLLVMPISSFAQNQGVSDPDIYEKTQKLGTEIIERMKETYPESRVLKRWNQTIAGYQNGPAKKVYNGIFLENPKYKFGELNEQSPYLNLERAVAIRTRFFSNLTPDLFVGMGNNYLKGTLYFKQTYSKEDEDHLSFAHDVDLIMEVRFEVTEIKENEKVTYRVDYLPVDFRTDYRRVSLLEGAGASAGN